MSARTIARRSLRAFAPVVAMVALVTLAMAVVATAIPRSVDGFLTAGLRYDAAQVSALGRDVEAQGAADLDFSPGDGDGMSEGASETWGLFDEQAEALRSAQPRPLRDALGRADYTVVTTPEPFAVSSARTVSLGYDPRFLSRITVVEGEAPAAGPRAVPGDEPIEVIATAPVADALEWPVGETRLVDLADRLQQPLTLSGIFEANDPDDGYWQHTTATLTPVIDRTNTEPLVFGTVFADAPGFTALLDGVAPFTPRLSVWFPVEVDSLETSTSAQLAQQLRKFSSTAQQVGDPGRAAMLFGSNLPDLLEEAAARSASSQAILATILAGPLGLAVAIEILVARLAAARFKASLALLAARGASATQRRLLLAVPALALGVVATAVGVALALLLPGGTVGVLGWLAITATALAPAVLLVVFAAGSDGMAPRLRRRVRSVGEAVVVLVAVASVASALQRGSATSGGSPGGSVDLVAAAAPLALTLLGCVVTLRLYPVVLRHSLAAAHRTRGIARFLGLARALRAGSAGLVPVLAVLIGVSVAVFSGVLTSTLTAGTETASAARVGADIAVDDVRLDPESVDAVRSVDGVAAVAAISSDLFHRITPENQPRFQATLLLVDPGELAMVQQGRPGALDLPDLAPSSDGTVPLVASEGVADALAGETTVLLDYSTDVTVVAPPVASEIFNTSANWVLADIANAEELNFPSPVLAGQLVVRLDPGASVDAVTADIVGLVGADATVSTPESVTALRSANPAVGGVRTATVLAILGSALLSAAALTLTTVLDGRSRRASLALLGTLGLGRRQARRTVAWELAPLSAVGLVVGVVLGAALAAIVLTTVDLRPFTDGIDQPGIVVDPLLMLAIGGGFALLLVVTVAAAAARATPRTRSLATDEGWDS